MKKVVLLLVLLFPFVSLAQQVLITGAHITDLTGTALQSGTMTWTPVNSQGVPIPLKVGGATGGIVVNKSVTKPIINGAISGTLVVADVSLTNPQWACYDVNIRSGNTEVARFKCVQPVANPTSGTSASQWCSGGVCNFDNLPVNLTPLVPAQSGPPGPAGPPGPVGPSGTLSSNSGGQYGPDGSAFEIIGLDQVSTPATPASGMTTTYFKNGKLCSNSLVSGEVCLFQPYGDSCIATAAGPVITPGAGSYTNSANVAISCATGSPYYSTNGTTVQAYTVPIALTAPASVTVRAQCIGIGYCNSQAVSQGYSVLSGTSIAVFDKPPGTYANSVAVSLSSTTGGAIIYYCTDTSNTCSPTTAYLGTPISVAPAGPASTYLRAKATHAGMLDSAVGSVLFTYKAAPPASTPVAGAYDLAQSVTLSSVTSGASVCYTIDGSAPIITNGSCMSALYSTPFTVGTEDGQTVRATAFKTNYTNSDLFTGSFLIGAPMPFIENFEGAISSLWVSSGTATLTYDSTTPPQGSQFAILTTMTTSDGSLSLDLKGSKVGEGSTLWVRFYFNFGSSRDGGITIKNDGDDRVIVISHSYDDSLGLQLFSSNTGTVTGSNPTVIRNTWYRVEMMVVASRTAGSIELRTYDMGGTLLNTKTITGADTIGSSFLKKVQLVCGGDDANTICRYDKLGLSKTGWLGQ